MRDDDARWSPEPTGGWRPPGKSGAGGSLLLGTLLLLTGAGGIFFMDMARRAGEPDATGTEAEQVVLGLAVAAVLGVLLLAVGTVAALLRRRTRRHGIRVEGEITQARWTPLRVGGSADGAGGATVYRLTVRGQGPDGPVELRTRSTSGSVGDACVVRYLPGREHKAVLMGLRRAPLGLELALAG